MEVGQAEKSLFTLDRSLRLGSPRVALRIPEDCWQSIREDATAKGVRLG